MFSVCSPHVAAKLVGVQADRRKHGIRDIDTESSRFTHHIEPLIGRLRIQELTSDNLEDLVTQLENKIAANTIKFKTANNVWAIASKMFGHAKSSRRRDLRVRTDTPAADVRGPDPSLHVKRRKSYLYPTEFLQLSSENVPVRWARIYALAIYTYGRAGEQAALILARQADLGWGAKVVDQLSRDLPHEFPDMKGFSPRNLKYMRAFAEAWPDQAFVQEVLAQITWYHNVALLEKVGSRKQQLFYAHKAIEAGWSRNVLVAQIDSKLYERQGKAVTNFERALPAPDSDLARQTLKDPYVFDFLGLEEAAQEREIELAMMQHIRDTLVEMGVGFAFVGRQVRLEVGGEEFFPDLLFYHLRLRCYVVVELKAGEFRPEHAGKLNFYLTAVDETVRDKDKDGPTIGLLLCRSKNQVVAEYALRDIQKPIGIADVQLTRLLPDSLQNTLPTVEALEAELADLPAREKEAGPDGSMGARCGGGEDEQG